MGAASERLPALLPALLLLLFAVWCGSFQGAAEWPAGALGRGALLGVALFAAGALRDPLALGAAGRWIPAAALVAAAGSWLASPVPRAGRTALFLLPVFLLLPAAIARAVAGNGLWPDARRRQLALGAWSVAVAVVALWALAVRPAGLEARAAMPLGHHNLLAALLALALPPAAWGLAKPGWSRATAFVALATGLPALALTRSWLGGLAGLATAAAVALALPRARRLIAGAALVVLGLSLPRFESMMRGLDSSGAARAVYAAAGIAGIRERPLVGWGPGATPWTLAEHLEPRPGVNPPGEAVGTLHSTALELGYELGLPGATLAVLSALLFLARRASALRAAADAPEPEALRLGASALLGLTAGGLMLLGNSLLATPAIPVGLGCLAGFALAASGGRPRRAGPGARLATAGCLLVAAGGLLAPALAERSYAAARAARDRAAARPHLERALALDPAFPLYRARRAWIADETPGERAREALRAAREARGVAALWLRAGGSAFEAGELAAARAAFARTMALDPLGGVAPYLAFLASGGRQLDCAARAIAAEPRLLAAAAWREAPAARAAALARLRGWPGLPKGYVEELERLAARLPGESGAEVDLGQQMDATPALSISLHQFRRPPWLADLARVRLERAAVRAFAGVGSAAARADVPPSAFPRDRCAPR